MHSIINDTLSRNKNVALIEYISLMILYTGIQNVASVEYIPLMIFYLRNTISHYPVTCEHADRGRIRQIYWHAQVSVLQETLSSGIVTGSAINSVIILSFIKAYRH